MIPVTKKLPKEEFADLIENLLDSSLFAKSQKSEVTSLVIQNAESANWSIEKILESSIKDIEQEDIRALYRQAVISIMYDVPAEYPGYETEKWIAWADDECVLIQCRNEETRVESTIVMSPTGEIKVPEGVFLVYERFVGVLGFPIRGIHGYGLLSSEGDVVLPCIFDEVRVQGRYNEIYYKGALFKFLSMQTAIGVAAKALSPDGITPDENLDLFIGYGDNRMAWLNYMFYERGNPDTVSVFNMIRSFAERRGITIDKSKEQEEYAKVLKNPHSIRTVIMDELRREISLTHHLYSISELKLILEKN